MNARLRLFLDFWRKQGTRAALRLVRRKIGNLVAGQAVLNPLPGGSSGRPATVQQFVAQSFPSLRAIPTFAVPASARPRISLVTDSIGSSSLFGGVGTALLMAALLANRMGATLRIVTRTEPPSPQNAMQVLDAYGVTLEHESQFVFVPPQDDAQGLPIEPGELFITTSWWSTAATLPSVPQESIVYLLQEDERMFYPFGEERLRCQAVLENRSIRFVLNTRLLYDHMIDSGLAHFREQAGWFEPAFPATLFHRRERGAESKRRFFFYARPNNLRNLFATGITAIDRAVNEGILDLERWDIYMVGTSIPNVTFGNGYVPRRCEGLGWKAYAELVGSIDLGLSLMYTPHPSYPPFDLAASGAVVLTNKCGNKQDLSGYSRNILCADLDPDSLVAGIAAGVALAEDEETRRRNHASNGLGQSWPEAFEPILQSLAGPR